MNRGRGSGGLGVWGGTYLGTLLLVVATKWSFFKELYKERRSKQNKTTKDNKRQNKTRQDKTRQDKRHEIVNGRVFGECE